MSDRIRALEEGLEKLQMQHYAVEHPLLKSDLLLIKTTFELYGLDPTQPENAKVEKNEDEDPFAADVSEDASQRNFFGPTAEPEVCRITHIMVIIINTALSFFCQYVPPPCYFSSETKGIR